MFDREYEPSDDMLLLDRAQEHAEGEVDVTGLIDEVAEGDLDVPGYFERIEEQVEGDFATVRLEGFKLKNSYKTIVPRVYTNWLGHAEDQVRNLTVSDIELAEKIAEICKTDEGWELISRCTIENAAVPSLETVTETQNIVGLLMRAIGGDLDKALSLYSAATEDYFIEDQVDAINEFISNLNSSQLSEPRNIDGLYLSNPNTTSIGTTFSKEEFLKLLDSYMAAVAVYNAGNADAITIKIHLAITNAVFMAFKIIDMCQKSEKVTPPEDILKLGEVARYIERTARLPEFISISLLNVSSFLSRLYEVYNNSKTTS